MLNKSPPPCRLRSRPWTSRIALDRAAGALAIDPVRRGSSSGFGGLTVEETAEVMVFRRDRQTRMGMARLAATGHGDPNRECDAIA
jgi:hypothetical protein